MNAATPPADGGRPVGTLPNIGPKLTRLLAEAGVTTVDELRALGAVRAFRRVQGLAPLVPLATVYAFEAALRDLPAGRLAPETRRGLRRAVLG